MRSVHISIACVATALVAPPRARPRTRRLATPIPPPPTKGARVVISYCPGCKWLLRSAYFAQELLTTFDGGELREVALSPAEIAGTWTVSIDDQIVWDRKADGGFPEAKILKRRVRDIVSPDTSLGHSDAAPPTQDVAPTQIVPPTQDMECAPTQLVPPSQACDLPDESALEFNSQPSQLTADDEEAEFQF